MKKVFIALAVIVPLVLFQACGDKGSDNSSKDDGFVNVMDGTEWESKNVDAYRISYPKSDALISFSFSDSYVQVYAKGTNFAGLYNTTKIGSYQYEYNGESVLILDFKGNKNVTYEFNGNSTLKRADGGDFAKVLNRK